MTAQNDEDRLKRLRIRSWRRGIKEMDLILGGWSDAHLRALPAEDVALYDELLAENDHDLYQWVTGQATAPDRFSGLIRRIADEFAAL
ncbi:MAG: succinate dehydrogenase assembly factor 2 [Alphaproteobacteria bacterium]|nr:succinate dehydrogenase assembly factor 2 [Alphaproteobacteria bacterium]NNF73472.1 succinate dehydrogenase assembly factor 2 [Paracoccaceae bacterium]